MRHVSGIAGVSAPEILLPSKDIDMRKWSVVACDQFTSQPGYWEEVENYVGASPSTLRMILPEAYINIPGEDERIGKINGTMERYLENGKLVSADRCFIAVERQVSGGAVRRGIIAALDLEAYDYTKGSHSLVRATEVTVVERLPPRIKIRRQAMLELPHIMVLFDDPGMNATGCLFDMAKKRRPAYDFDLMQGGGNIKGYALRGEEDVEAVLSAFEKLADTGSGGGGKNNGRNGSGGIDDGAESNSGDTMLFAVGDGNHSLAAAKAHWEDLKRTLTPDSLEVHPARYALVELVNIHDGGLVFEPIHRVVFNAPYDDLSGEMRIFFEKRSARFKDTLYDSREAWERAFAGTGKKTPVHVLPYISGGKYGTISIENPGFNLEAAALQAFLDAYAATRSGMKIDYIHGDDVLEALSSACGNTGFMMPPADKNKLFTTVMKEGALPKKTFSMGEASDKRYYLECRQITL